MNAATMAKARESFRKSRAMRREQTILIDSEWRLVRIDEFNWQIQYGGKNEQGFKARGFYSSLLTALSALPAKMLSEEAKNSLATVLDAQKGILERIEKAVRLAELSGRLRE